MWPFGALGKTLMLFGALIFVIGGLLTLAGQFPGVGRLPGDILIQRKNFSFYLPLGTSILLSILLTLVFSFLANLFFRK